MMNNTIMPRLHKQTADACPPPTPKKINKWEAYCPLNIWPKWYMYMARLLL